MSKLNITTNVLSVKYKKNNLFKFKTVLPIYLMIYNVFWLFYYV